MNLNSPDRKWALAAAAIIMTIAVISYFGSVRGMGPDATIEESDSPGDSDNKYWWVDSGAYFYVEDGTGSTVHGSLPADDKWRIEYAAINPQDTDNGYHPQNIFRLLTKSKWNGSVQEAYFWINEYRLSASPNRAEHNGILFFSRYIDENNLYYAGIRVDGNATIKKKSNGEYYIMQMSKAFPGTYDRNTAPNLIPENSWIGLRSVTLDNPDGTVSIQLYIDKGGTGKWALVAEATDDNSSFGGPALAEGSGGIRTDFMDVSMKKYEIADVEDK